MLGIHEEIKKIPVGWEMGIRILSHNYGCQGPTPTKFTKSLIKRVVVIWADTAEGDTPATEKKMPNRKIVPF